jgi:small GTP-binding protein
MALDDSGHVIGIKLADVGEAAPEIISKICELRYLERIVFYTRFSSAIPPEIQNLKRLKYLVLGGEIRRFPEELLSLGLPLVSESSVNVIKNRVPEFAHTLSVSPPGESEWETNVVDQGLLTKSITRDILSIEGVFIQAERLEDPPIEIVRKGFDAVRLYFQERSQGDLPLNELKVILVGNGGAGKTSLVKRIIGEDFDPEESQTHGINIRQWDVDAAQRQVKLHFWDFGGQEVMHATHQFFLSKRSIYILVLDGRKDEDPEYWLQHIESFGGDSPVLLVLNRIDEHPAFEVNRRFLKNKYKGIVGFFRVSCAKNRGLGELKSSLIEELGKVPMLQTRWPKSWFKIKQELNSLDSPFLSLVQFQELCAQEMIVDESNQELLVEFLNDLGVVLHFKDMELLDTHVLDPRWVTDGVYKIINSELLARKRGLLLLNQVGKILSLGGKSEYPAEKHLYIVNLMLKFELCYRIDDRAILVPDLLDIQEPELNFKDEDALHFVFEYGYLPKSVMLRFIVRMHGDIQGDRRWRTGVVLADKNLQAEALVRADEKAKRLYISVRGEQKRDYFSIIKKVITDINSSFEKLQITEYVPLPDVPDVLIDYSELRGYEIAKRSEIFVGRLGRAYDVQALLNGIEKLASRETQVILVQGDYYVNPNTTTHSTQIMHSARITVNESGENMGYVAKTWEKVIVYLSGVAFMSLVGYLLIRNDPIADPNLVVVVRTILSLVVALFGATIPGMLRVDFSAKGLTIRAIGALALFVLTFVFTPNVLR